MARNKAPDKPSWDDLPGFDTNTSEYVHLNCDLWLADNQITEEGHRSGKEEHPPSDQQSLDGVEYKIEAWINHRGRKCKDDVSRKLSDITESLNSIEDQDNTRRQEHEVTEITTDADLEINRGLEHDKNRLIQLKKEIIEGSEDYEQFRKKAGLTRLADYSGRKNAYFIMCACALIEVVFNAAMLKDVHSLGLIGAVIQMFLITGINIFLGGIVVGEAWRYKNYISIIKKITGWFLVTTVTAMIFAFNLTIGHYRDSMQALVNKKTTIVESGNDVLERMLATPFRHDSLESALLVLIGLLCFGIAAWKGYKRDDAYPEYGQRHRQLNALTRTYRIRYDKARGHIEAVYEKATNRLKDIRHKIEIKQQSYQGHCDRGKRIVDQYSTNLRQYQDDLNYLLTSYRTENRRARTTPVPAFFDQERQIDSDILTPPMFTPPRETNFERVLEEIHIAIKRVQDSYERAIREYPGLEEITAESFDTGVRA